MTNEVMWKVGPGYRVYPPKLNMCAEVLDRHVAEGRGDATAVIWQDGRWTFAELQRVVNAYAAKAKENGIGKGDRMLVLGRNSPQVIASVLAGLKIGAVPVLLNSLLSESEIDYIIDNSGARTAFAPSSSALALRSLLARDRLDQLFILQGATESAKEMDCSGLDRLDVGKIATLETDALDEAFMVYSSGTTGRPKGIVHAHRWVVTVGDPNVLMMTFSAGDVVATTGEYSFMGNFGHALIFPLYAGAAVATYGERVSPDSVFAFFEATRPTIFLSVPTFYRAMLATSGFTVKLRGLNFRFMVSTGEALGASVWNRWHEETGIKICEIYGVSEVQTLLSNSPLMTIKPGSIGKAGPGVKVALLDEGLNEVAPNEPGVFSIHRSDSGFFLGYYKQPDKWKSAHRGDWFYTGDVMRVDEDGYYWYLGRSDDLFKSRGYLISPHEIENVVQRHPAVAEVAVAPKPDERIGNVIVAFVLLKEGHNGTAALETEILEFARTQLAPYKVPKELIVVTELPKSPVGKIVRRALATKSTETV